MRMILLLVVGMLTLLAGAVAEEDDDFKVWIHEEDGIIVTSDAYVGTYNMTTDIYRSDDGFDLQVMFPGPAAGGWRFFGIPNGTLCVDVTYDDQLLYSDSFELQLDQAVFFRYASEDISVDPKQRDFGYNVHLGNFSVPKDIHYIIADAVIRTEDNQAFASSDILLTQKIPELICIYAVV